MPSVIFENHDYFSESNFLSLGYADSLSDEILPTNWHEHIEILVCKKGSATIILDDRKYSFSENNIIIINPNVMHSFKGVENAGFYCMHIDSSFLNTNFENAKNTFFTEFIEFDKNAINLIEELCTAYNSDDYLKAPKIKILLLKLLILFFENYGTDNIYSTYNSKVYKRIKTVMSYIENNLSREFTLDGIAAEVNINKYQLSREFKDATGQTVFQYINRLRCKAASSMLKNGASVTEACESCGFKNLSYFSATYKKYIGILPGKTKFSSNNRFYEANLYPVP